MYMTTPIHWTVSSEDEGKARATDRAPVVASLGFRAAAAADQCASLARLLSPVLDVLIRLWLAGGFLVTGMLSWGGDFGWITLLNLPLLGLPLLYGAGAISLDHAIAAAFRRRFPPFEALPAAAVARLPHVVIVGGGFGGVAAVRGLRYAPCRVPLLDQHN